MEEQILALYDHIADTYKCIINIIIGTAETIPLRGSQGCIFGTAEPSKESR